MIFFISFNFPIAIFWPLLSKTPSFIRYYSLRFTTDIRLKGQWEPRNKVGSLNLGEHPVRFEPTRLNPMTCSPHFYYSTVYVLPNLVTLRSSFRLFPLSISFGRTLSLRSSIISAYYCTAQYTTTSVSLWVFLSNSTISTLVSLS